MNALTGEDVLGKSPVGTVLQGVDLISGPSLGAYTVPDISNVIVLLDDLLQVRLTDLMPLITLLTLSQVHVYPERFTNEKEFTSVVGKLNVALRTDKAGRHQLTGHQFSAAGHGRPTAFVTWASSFSSGEKILSIIPRPSGPVASLGKVLGNRTTFYKYLNPHLFAVTTVSPTTCGVYVLDATKGNIVYHTSITASQGKGSCDLHATFVENWLVYVYWDEEYQWVGQAKGPRLVTVELYEGSMPDDKTKR